MIFERIEKTLPLQAFWAFVAVFPPVLEKFCTVCTGFSTEGTPFSKGKVWKTLLKVWKTLCKTGENG
ncbi:MAG: hypothetical protein ACLTWO_12420 [Blautia massiliensis (ex Durand et al. 2017)]